MKVSTILVCYNKFEHFDEVILGWLAQPEVDDITILDNSGTFKTDLPVMVVNVNKNMGVQGKWPLAFWAKHDVVCFFDDDILVQEGLVADFLKYYNEGMALSLIGANFEPGETYYAQAENNKKGATRFRADGVEQLTKVEWFGAGASMINRKYCAVPVREAPYGNTDLWWESQLREQGVEFYVIPSEKWSSLPEQKDSKRSWHLGSYSGGMDEWRRAREENARKFGFLKPIIGEGKEKVVSVLNNYKQFLGEGDPKLLEIDEAIRIAENL